MKRIEYIDYAKCFAILFIVVGHIIQSFSVWSTDDPLFKFIYSFHVPLFFFLSGYVAQMTREKGFSKGVRSFLLRKIETLLLPFLIWSLVINRYVDILSPQPTVLEVFQSPDRGTWFLLSLFLVQVACTPLLRYQKWYVIALNIIALAVCSYYINSFFYLNYMHWMPYVVGLIVAKWNKFVLSPMLATLALIIFMVCEILHPHPVMASISLGIALLYVCGQIKADNAISRQVLSIGQNTLGIYVLHYFFIWAVGHNVIDMSGLHNTLTLTVLMIIAFVISIVCVYITRTLQYFPVVGYLLFGKRIVKHKEGL